MIAVTWAMSSRCPFVMYKLGFLWWTINFIFFLKKKLLCNDNITKSFQGIHKLTMKHKHLLLRSMARRPLVPFRRVWWFPSKRGLSSTINTLKPNVLSSSCLRPAYFWHRLAMFAFFSTLSFFSVFHNEESFALVTPSVHVRPSFSDGLGFAAPLC